MSTDLIDRVTALIDGASPADEADAGANPSAAALAGELTLWAARSFLDRDALGRAAELLFAGASRARDAAFKQDVARQLLRLAKLWARAGSASGTDVDLERALRTAAELDPVQALAPLAQQLERIGNTEEAVSRYREAIRLAPQEAGQYLSLARLYERVDRPHEALAIYLQLTEAAPTAKNYLVAAERLRQLAPALGEPAPNRTLKIALLGSATLDHLQSYLLVECYRAGLFPELYQGGFDQYTQEILNPQSGLYKFAPDVLICAVHSSRLFPQLHGYPFDLTVAERTAEMDAGLKTLEQLLIAFRQHSSALVLLHNMVAPQHPALGILDLREELGQSAAFAEVNRRLAMLARERYRNVYIVDEERVQASCGKARATDPRLWLMARIGWSEAMLPGLVGEYLRYLRPFKGMSRKCIVLDLDNTLWGGVIGEDGLAGIQLGADAPGNAFTALQHELDRLWRRGVLLAVCSKNNPEDALAVFERHPDMVLKLSQVAAYRINWEPKPANVRDLAQELNIGLDSLVFLDDNPVERAQMRTELPQVLTPELPTDPAQYRNALLKLGVFESLAFTEEDRNRGRLYAREAERRDYETRLGGEGSLGDYLAGLEMVVDIEPADAVSLPRIAQLTNKTNQFNLTTRRYSEAQLEAMRNNGGHIYFARVRDRFGDYGLVGVLIALPGGRAAWEIDTLLLSCRAMGRGVERAVLAYVAHQARQNGAQYLRGWFVPTAKNAPARDCYREHGFRSIETGPDERVLWELNLAESMIESPAWLTVPESTELVSI